MKKNIFILLLLLSSFSYADDYIHNVSLLGKKNKCIYNDYYTKKGKLFYHYVSNDKHYSTTSKTYIQSIVGGYQYDKNTSVCSPEQYLILGMTATDWHFLEALTGLLFGFVFMVFTIYLFINVGGKR